MQLSTERIMTDEVQQPAPTKEEVLEFLNSPQPTSFERCGPLDLTIIHSILGPPPVLSNENAEAYNAMLLHYMKSLQPQDFLLQMLVKDLADADWEALRIKRHKAWAIERRNQIARQIEARHSAAVERKRIADSKKEKPETEQDKLQHLEREVNGLSANVVKAVDHLKTPSRDIELSTAMEEAISYYERLDRLEKDCLAKRVIILEQIRLYEEALLLKRQREPHYEDPSEIQRLKAVILELKRRR
jgi:hypothetical protein